MNDRFTVSLYEDDNSRHGAFQEALKEVVQERVRELSELERFANAERLIGDLAVVTNNPLDAKRTVVAAAILAGHPDYVQEANERGVTLRREREWFAYNDKEYFDVKVHIVSSPAALKELQTGVFHTLVEHPEYVDVGLLMALSTKFTLFHLKR